MHGRRTVWIGAIVALGATVSISLITAMHLRAGDRRARYETLIALEAGANYIKALDWKVSVSESVPVVLQAEVLERLHAMRAEIERLARAGDDEAPGLLSAFDSYQRAVREEFALARARVFQRAARHEQNVEGPAYERFRERMRAAASTNRRLAMNSERGSWVGTAVIGMAAIVLVTGLLARLDRASRRRAREAALRRLAFQDALTGLPNRPVFEQRIAEALAGGGHTTVAFIDLDDFKQVNDSLGHPAGDRLLQIAGERLQRALRQGDIVARLGGDEFAVLAHDVDDLDAFVQRIFDVLAAPVMLEGKRLHLRASIGIATSDTGDDLLRNADLAMYSAKAAGTNRSAVFTIDLHTTAVERLDRREQLERAVENEEMVLHYQPIVDLDLGRVAGFEALVRWEHPTRGLVGPNEFVPLAEETGMIIPLGRWVLRTAASEAAQWAGAPYLSVNVANVQLEQPGFVEEVARALEDGGLDPRRLVLEVTESSLVGDESAAKLQELRRMGVRLAIDDFGTGYSSLSYLRRFPMDVLKIDRSFTRDVCEDDALLRAIVAMGESLGLVLVSEGIEEPEQAEALRALGCRLGQGYLFGHPAPAAELSGIATVV
jgi:diguanylate cyclase (GGDEF)-like protein